MPLGLRLGDPRSASADDRNECSPTESMFRFGLFMTLVIFRMQIGVGRRNRTMAKVIAHMPKIHRISHAGAGGMPHPMRRGILNHMSEAFKLNSSITNPGGGSAEHLLDDQMHRTARQRALLSANGQEEGSGLTGKREGR